MEVSLANVTSDTSRKRARQNADLFFHEEVLVEILARLPVRSLLRFKCVCKTWFSLIGSEYFAGKHLSARSMMFKDDNYKNLLVDYHHNPDGHNGMTCLQFLAVDFDTLSVVHHKFKIISSSREYFVNRNLLTCLFAGSCNGIVCLLIQDYLLGSVASQQSLLLWNPATGEVKTLQHEKHITVLGFGFDSKMNDYKVVLINRSLIPETTETIEHVSVYSLRSDSWKTLNRPHGPEFQRFVRTSTTSSGGRMLNWLGIRRDMDYHHRTDKIVISFDLTEETFVMTPMPPETECKCGRKHQSCCLIQNTQDGPCTIVCFPPDHKIDDERDCLDNGKIINIWSLNEYGDSGSWTKLLSLVMFDNYVWLDHFVFWKGGEVLFEIKQHKGKLQQASYNPITRQLRLIRLEVGLALATRRVLFQSMGDMVEGYYLMIPTGRSTMSRT
ncbi:hypothetical protein Dimus_032462 [Dionaea muscipula]